MEKNNHNEDFHDELRSLSEVVSSDDDENELNPLQEIFGAQSSSLPKEESDARNYKAKRQHTNEDRVTTERKRRRVIKEKLDILLKLITPNPPKMDHATTLDFIVESIKYMDYQKDVLSKVYTDAGYLPACYGAQAPLVSPYANPWGYYAPPLMPQQNMYFIPQFPEPNSFNVPQGYDTTQFDKTQL